MATTLLRGRVESVSIPAPNGAAECRIGDKTVALHRDLADSVKQGDDVLVAGFARDKVLKALALNNVTRSKLAQIDCTNNILLLGLGGFLAILFGVFGLGGSNGAIVSSLEDAVAIAGIILGVVSLRALWRVIRAASWVDYPTA
jgi:hypothetical protein